MANRGYTSTNDDIFGVEGDSASYRCYTYGDVDGMTPYNSISKQYFRLTKVGSTVSIYRKDLIGDDWILVRSSGDMGSAFLGSDLYVKLYSGQVDNQDNYFDDFVINSFDVMGEENASAAHWSDWIDAIEIHALITYDHPKIVSDILLKQDIIPVSETEPVAPTENDLWIDIST
jgi:hypothetical protein